MDLAKLLSPSQFEAATRLDAPVCILAGAGSGKTRVITHRIAWLMTDKRETAESILAVTFTNKAAGEMRERVDRLVPYGYATTPIKTFHAWGDELLRENAHRLGIAGELRVLGRAEVVLLLREHLFELGLSRFAPLGDPTRFLGDVAGYISRAKEEAVTPDQVDAFAAALRSKAAAVESDDNATEKERSTSAEYAAALRRLGEEQAELAAVYRSYRSILAKRGLLDFGDQVLLSHELLQSDPLVAARVRERHRWLLVDEYQDTNRLQGALVDLITQGNGNLTAVGQQSALRVELCGEIGE